MKTDFRFIILTAILFSLSACGKQRTSSSAFEKGLPGCEADALPKRFIVKNFDGSIKMVEAASKDAFIDGYLTENLDQVEYAEHDYRVHSQGEIRQADDMIRTYADNWGIARVDAPSLWQQNVRGAGVTVAIVDTGMDIGHPQLRKQIATNPGELGTDAQGRDKSTNGIDDDGNGYVDDAGGFDFVENQPLQGDYTGHGTHIAGIIAAAHNDSTAQAGAYVQGIAPAAKILPLAFMDETGSGSMLNGVYAIRYAVKRGAKIISASWGGSGCSRALKDTIAGLEAQGVIFVAAAGNEGRNIDYSPMYPASLDYAAQIVVGSVGDHDNTSRFSNYGRVHVHIHAPGADIISTYPGGRMAVMSGTSMSTPLVAGAIALLLSAEPTAGVAKIRQTLYSSARKSADYINASQGRMNLSQALALLRQ